MTLRRWVVPVALSLLVVVIVVGVVRLSTSGGRSPGAHSRPPVLHLASAGRAAAGAPDVASATGAPTGSQGFVLTGSLPAGQPADRPVWQLATATADDASRVAAALGLTGRPQRVNGGWVLRAGTDRLVVRDNSSWSYGLDCMPDQPVSSEDVTVMCATSTASGAAVAAGPSAADARTAATPVFDRLGLGDAPVTVVPGDPSATVQAAPRLDGLVTSGWATSVQIDAAFDVVSADGWLGGAERGVTYPLITAQRAFALLQERPRPMTDLCMVRKDGKPGCADIPPTEVTGAALGLALDYDGERALLVPAWLFAVKGQSEPLAQVAVDPAYLAPPTVPTAEPPTPGSGTSGSAEPGAPAPTPILPTKAR